MSEIAILGTGNIGGTLARRWAQAGHDLTLGVRDTGTDHVRALVDELTGAGVTVSAAPIEAAISSAPVVVIAIPGLRFPISSRPSAARWPDASSSTPPMT
jgi:8-hydroxy-5-deazaflavin:NADPH oxidoreductase